MQTINRENVSKAVQTYETVQSLPPTGNNKVVTILMQFQDVKFQNQQTINSLIDYQLNSDASMQYGSVKEYFNEASYGLQNLDFTVLGPYTAEGNMADYGKNYANGDPNHDLTDALIKEAMTIASTHIDFEQFDNNHDNNLDVVHVIYAGHGESESKELYSNAIWPHRGYLRYTSVDGLDVNDYIVTPELDGSDISPIGTICHELGHAMGAPDFYDTDDNDNGDREGTGKWEMDVQIMVRSALLYQILGFDFIGAGAM